MLCIINIKTREGSWNFSSLYSSFFDGEYKNYHTGYLCGFNYQFFILRKSLVPADYWKTKIKDKIKEEKEKLARDNKMPIENYRFEVSFVESTDYIF